MLLLLGVRKSVAESRRHPGRVSPTNPINFLLGIASRARPARCTSYQSRPGGVAANVHGRTVSWPNPPPVTPRQKDVGTTESLWTLQRYSLVILPTLVVAEQLGIPLPAVPALLGVGALAAAGQVSLPQVLGVIVVVALSVDLGWYELGRRRGAAVLTKICRMSLRPHSCVGRTERTFARYGAAFILVAKFVPGLTTLVPPLAGIAGIGRVRFAVYEVGGVLLWAGTWLGLGYFFSDAVSSIALTAARLGRMLGVVVVAAAGAYVLVRYLRQRVSLRTFHGVPDVAEPAKKMPAPILARTLDGIGRDPEARHDGQGDDTPMVVTDRRAA